MFSSLAKSTSTTRIASATPDFLSPQTSNALRSMAEQGSALADPTRSRPAEQKAASVLPALPGNWEALHAGLPLPLQRNAAPVVPTPPVEQQGSQGGLALPVQVFLGGLAWLPGQTVNTDPPASWPRLEDAAAVAGVADEQRGWTRTVLRQGKDAASLVRVAEEPCASKRTVLEVTDEQLIEALRQRFGHSGFREGQIQCIQRTLSGIDQLMVLPTGGGKSLLYQLPASLFPGTTLVVSPLVALMEDQLRGLHKAGIEAACLHSGQSPELQAEILRRLAAGQLKVLLAAPERLTTRRLQAVLEHTAVSLVAVDEAHCVSEWGHDFRPEYRQLQPLLRRLGCVVLAITATATAEVQQDICDGLGIPTAFRAVMGFDRQNLRFGVHPVRTESERLGALAEYAERLVEGCGIVYVTTRNEADDLAFRLTRRLRQRVCAYHAGLPADIRLARQQAFQHNELQWLVATNAFGMGIDKPDVRIVLHARPPRSLEDYVQESGRASRDGQPALCCLLASPQDFEDLSCALDRESQKPERLELRRRRIQAVHQFAMTRGCRRQAILGYFGSSVRSAASPCCDRCNRWRWGWLS